jgi:hypothetical protein
VIQDWVVGKTIKWKFAPAGGQHMNGQAEKIDWTGEKSAP